tara:strand:+ start:87 stop:437 length:351 start_codon:yes stop_codon:yes gene_type:complete
VKINTAEGPNKKLSPNATPINPKVFALFSGEDISANTVVAVATVPPLIPSINLAMNSKYIGNIEVAPITKKVFDQSKSTVKASKDIPKIDPKMHINITGLLPNLSLKSPIEGDAMN